MLDHDLEARPTHPPTPNSYWRQFPFQHSTSYFFLKERNCGIASAFKSILKTPSKELFFSWRHTLYFEGKHYVVNLRLWEAKEDEKMVDLEPDLKRVNSPFANTFIWYKLSLLLNPSFLRFFLFLLFSFLSNVTCSFSFSCAKQCRWGKYLQLPTS